MVLPRELEEWAIMAAPVFKHAGAAGGADLAFARLYVALWHRGLNPRITSLFRDPGKQRAMRQAWDSGNRAGLRARPADPSTSLHCQTSFAGTPASRAIDIVCDDDIAAAAVARSLQVGAGADFRDPDMGHYYLR